MFTVDVIAQYMSIGVIQYKELENDYACCLSGFQIFPGLLKLFIFGLHL